MTLKIPDPNELAKKGSAPKRMKRFYKEVSLHEEGDHFHLKLDGRGAKTPAKRSLALDNHQFAMGLVNEWESQGEEIDPAKMIYTKLANSAIDGVADNVKDVIEDICRYGETDVMCYRAAHPEVLVKWQAEQWDPILNLVHESFEVTLNTTSALVAIDQPAPNNAKLNAELKRFDRSALALAGLQVMTSLCSSAYLALLAAHQKISADEAWQAAHVDEDWNIKQWGEDVEAANRRAARRDEYDVAFVAASTQFVGEGK